MFGLCGFTSTRRLAGEITRSMSSIGTEPRSYHASSKPVLPPLARHQLLRLLIHRQLRRPPAHAAYAGPLGCRVEADLAAGAGVVAGVVEDVVRAMHDLAVALG